MASDSGKCVLCEERGDYKCNLCRRKVCVYDSSARKCKYEVFVSCDECRANALRPELDNSLQNKLEESKQELINHLVATGRIEDDIKELEKEEPIRLNLLEELAISHNEVVKNLKYKLVIEENSMNNDKATYENISNAVELQQSRVELLSKDLTEVQSEIESLKIIIEDKERENQGISMELRTLFHVSKHCTDLNTVERILCDKCRIRLLGIDEISSVLHSSIYKSPKGACSSCISF